jgi:peptidoglycan/LPS O-acetylase OafA/YrhL
MVKDIRALTGVRGVAAALIAVYHFGHVHLYSGGMLTYISIPHAYLAVDLFFMLSGFVIAYVYQHAFLATPASDFRDFMIKRVARLYPAYLVISVLYLIKIAMGLSGEQLSSFSAYDIVGNVLMLTGWGLHVHPIVGVSWAASAELGSYLLVPLLLALVVRGNVVAALVAAALAIAAICWIEMAGGGSSGPLDVVRGDSFYPLLRAVAGFTLGQVIYRFAGRLQHVPMPYQDAWVVLNVIAIVVVAAVTNDDLPLYLLFIPLVAILSRDGRAAQLLFGNRLVYHLGLISYSIYLLHPLFVSFAVGASRQFGLTRVSYLTSTAVCLALIWLLSYLSWRFVEMPGKQIVTDLLSVKRQRPSAPRTA